MLHAGRDLLHEEILQNTLEIVVLVIRRYPAVSEKVILDPKFVFSSGSPNVAATPALAKLLGMLLLHPLTSVRVLLAEAFTVFANISPRTFRAVLRQSLDDLVHLKDVYIQSTSFSSSVAQFFGMTTNLAHSSMGQSLMAEGGSEFIRYIPMLLGKLGVDVRGVLCLGYMFCRSYFLLLCNSEH